MIGRLLRDQMRAEAAERAHPEWAAQRIRRREIAAQVLAEREARWPTLTAENVAEAERWKETRIAELEEAEGLR